MGLSDSEAQRQIQQMVSFILNEAQDKAQEIEAKALEDYNIEKLKLVQQMKEKIRNEYEKKAKQFETERSIARSTAVNKARLKKVAAKDQMLKLVSRQSSDKLNIFSKDSANYADVCVKLIVQGLLILLEPEVIVRCREADKAIVQGAFSKAIASYQKILQDQVGVKKPVKLSLDTSGYYLPPAPSAENTGDSCLGGVVLMTADRKISCNNTLDERLRLVLSQCAPEIKKLLFEEPKASAL